MFAGSIISLWSNHVWNQFFQKCEIWAKKKKKWHTRCGLLSPGRAQMWAAHRRWGWHLLERWGCWQGWPRRFPLRRPPRGPERPPSRRDCPRSPRSGRSAVVVVGEVGTRRKVEVPVPPDRQHYPESPDGRRRGESEERRAPTVCSNTPVVTFSGVLVKK